jgi:chromosome segregation ATPase
MLRATETHAARATAEEARTWKSKHDTMATAATELAYKLTASGKEMEELKGRHANLHSNHEAMKTKYRSVKQGVKAATAESGHGVEWQQEAMKWKSQCKDLATKFETHIRATKTHVSASEAERKALTDKLRHVDAERRALSDKLERSGCQSSPDSADELDHMFADLITAQTDVDMLQVSLREQQGQVVEAQCENARLSREIAQLKREIPSVKAKLQEGRMHASLVQTLQKQLASSSSGDRSLQHQLEASEELARRLQKQLASSSTGDRSLQKRLEASGELVESLQKQLETERGEGRATASALAKLQGEIPGVKARIQEGKIASRDLAASHEKLRAATQTMSDQARAAEDLRSVGRQHAGTAKQCAHMLASTAQVLRACTELHAQQDSPLCSALRETTSKVDQFLSGLGAPIP